MAYNDFLNFLGTLWARFASIFAPVPIASPTEKERHNISLLELPLELLLMIVEPLSMMDSKMLALTCPQLRNALRSACTQLRAPTCLTYEEHCELLARISRDDPNVWACEKCHTLHEFHPGDIYGAGPFRSACPSRRTIDEDEGHYSFWFWPRYRHVQMAIKLYRQQRLTARQDLYYRRLMRRKHYSSSRTYGRPSLRGAYEVFPKIVQGRLLLKIVQYVEDREWVSQRLFLPGIGENQLKACEHQHHYHADIWTSWSHQHRRREQVRRGTNPGTDRLLPNEEMETAVESAHLERGETIEHSCSRCPTDFTVQIWETSAILCVWADLGGETSITDEIWDVHKLNVPRLSPPYWIKTAMEHEPGSVRRLYESVA